MKKKKNYNLLEVEHVFIQHIIIYHRLNVKMLSKIYTIAYNPLPNNNT